jgi:hypothetical protein
MATTKKKVNPLLPMSAGCIAGGIEACAVWPMEFIKVSFFYFFVVPKCRTKCEDLMYVFYFGVESLDFLFGSGAVS